MPTAEERQLLINMLTGEIEASKFPLSPRIERLKRRAKLRGEELAVAEPLATKRQGGRLPWVSNKG